MPVLGAKLHVPVMRRRLRSQQADLPVAFKATRHRGRGSSWCPRRPGSARQPCSRSGWPRPRQLTVDVMYITWHHQQVFKGAMPHEGSTT